MKKAFTLAEVLITLVILGVVSAVTIPTVSGVTRDAEYKSKAKKTFSSLSQAMAMASLQGYIPVVGISNNDNSGSIKDWYKMYIDPYLTTTKVCYKSSAGCWNSGDTKYLNGQNVYYNVRGKGIGANFVTAILNDGTFINIDSYGSSSMRTYFGTDTKGKDGLVIFFDVNGEKRPNKVGKDIFVAVYKDGGLIPPYTDDVGKIDKDCSRTGTGYSCLYSILDKSLQ